MSNASLSQARILNIARRGAHWFVELPAADRCHYLRRSGGRVAVAPAIGREMVQAAQREGTVASVHTWGPWTTWRLGERQ